MALLALLGVRSFRESMAKSALQQTLDSCDDLEKRYIELLMGGH